MAETATTPKPMGRAATLALLAGVLALSLYGLRAERPGGVGAWLDVAAPVVAGVLVAASGRRGDVGRWLGALAAAPMAWLVVGAAEPAVSGDVFPVVRLVVVAAALAYLWMASPLPPRMQYGACCGALGLVAVFFAAWEQPAPMPVPIRQSLVENFPKRMMTKLAPGRYLEYTGTHQPISGPVEGMLGADEYLNYSLRADGSGEQVVLFVVYNADAMSNVPHVPWVCMREAGYQQIEAKEEGVVVRPGRLMIRTDRDANLLRPGTRERQALDMLTQVGGTAMERELKERAECDDAALERLRAGGYVRTEEFPGREVPVNVLLFEETHGAPKRRALMFHYFRVGETYTRNRQLARLYGTTGALGQKGSFISQTQLTVWLNADEKSDPTGPNSLAYRKGVAILSQVVPILEEEFYPRLGKANGG